MKVSLDIVRPAVLAAIVVALAACAVGIVVTPGLGWALRAIMGAGVIVLAAGLLVAARARAMRREVGREVQLLHKYRPEARWRTLPITAVAFGVSIACTVAAVVGSHKAVHDEAQARFELMSERIVAEASRRVALPVYGLKGARGIYAASTSVRRLEFAEYVASRNIEQEFPGALGFGVIHRVRREDLDAFVAAERADDAPEFAIKSLAVPGATLHSTPDLYVIKHCFPKERNYPAWGLDVGSEPMRRAALERAVRSGEATTTGKIILVQDEKQRAGFLFFVPVYQTHVPLDTPAQREAALIEIVYAPMILDEALLGLPDKANGELDFEIFDGESPGEETRLYDFNAHAGVCRVEDHAGSADPHMFARSATAQVGDRTWTLVTSTTPAFDATLDHTTPILIAIGGTVMSVLVAGFVLSMLTGRTRAFTLAREMTATLAEAKRQADRLADIARRTSNAVIITDAMGRIEWVNEGFTRISGYTPGEVVGKKPGSILTGPNTDQATSARMGDAVRRGEGFIDEIVNYGKDGREYIIAIEIVPLRGADGSLTGFMAIENDVTEQKRAEALLAQSESRLKEMGNIASMGGWSLDIETGTLEWSEVTRQIHEVDDDYVPTLEAAIQFYAPEARAEIEAAVAQGIENGTAWDAELPFITAKGRRLWVRALGQAEYVNGKATRVYGAFQDITTRKAAQLELALSSARLSSIIARAEIFAWEYSWEEDRYLFVSFGEERLGYRREMWMQPGFWESIIHKDDRDALLAHTAAESAAGRAHRLNYRMVAADGSVVHISDYVSAPEMRDGRMVLRGVAMDVTERVLGEQRIMASERRFRTLVEGAEVVVWEFDPATEVFTYVSPQALKFGYPMADWFTKGFWARHIHADDRERAIKYCMKETAAGRDHRFTYRMRAADGHIVWIDDVVTVEKRPGGAPLVRGVMVDISDRMKSQQDLEAAQSKAEAASRAKSAFLANMSHEIRTPLTAILGFADVLREEATMTPEQRHETVDTIRHAGAHLLTVINDILDLSKIEADKMEVEAVETPLVAILREVESLVRSRAETKGLSLRTVLTTPVPEKIMSDPTRLRQILMNLAGNAVKFTDSGGITISAGTMEMVGQQRLVIDVEDTGKGLSPEQVARLFIPFTQADTSVTREHGGTGLGLVICRRLASLLHGIVKVQRTEPGKGSCFRLVLPLEVAAGSGMIEHLDAVESGPIAAAANTLTAGVQSAKVEGRILLVEDGVDNQRLIAFHLRKAGATVDVADNGRIALTMIDSASTPYDLVLSDMQMPEMDGYTLARTLRARGSRLPIVALTAHAMAEDRARCLDAGCDGYATKPIDKAALLATCRLWLGREGGKATKAA